MIKELTDEQLIELSTQYPCRVNDWADAIDFARAVIAAHEALQAGQEPLFWARLRSDGGYEGPIHNASIEAVRKQSGSWTALYAAPQPAQALENSDRWRLEQHHAQELEKTGAAYRKDVASFVADLRSKDAEIAGRSFT